MPWEVRTPGGFLGVVANGTGENLRKGADMATHNGMANDGFDSPRVVDLGADRRVLMTLRVSRDSGRTWQQSTRVREGDPFVILSDPGRYPPCGCARCMGQDSPSVTPLRPAAIEPRTA